MKVVIFQKIVEGFWLGKSFAHSTFLLTSSLTSIDKCVVVVFSCSGDFFHGLSVVETIQWRRAVPVKNGVMMESYNSHTLLINTCFPSSYSSSLYNAKTPDWYYFSSGLHDLSCCYCLFVSVSKGCTTPATERARESMLLRDAVCRRVPLLDDSVNKKRGRSLVVTIEREKKIHMRGLFVLSW